MRRPYLVYAQSCLPLPLPLSLPPFSPQPLLSLTPPLSPLPPSPQLSAQTHVDASKALQALLRTSVELGRLEIKARQFDAARGVLGEALAAAQDKMGDDSQEAGEGGMRGFCIGAWPMQTLVACGGVPGARPFSYCPSRAPLP